MNKKIISILICTILILTISPYLKLTSFTQGSSTYIENDGKYNGDCFLGDDVLNYNYENNDFIDSDVVEYPMISEDLVYDDYVLSDPVNVKIRYTDSVKNNGTRGITVQTRYAIPPTSTILPNQVIYDEIIYDPDEFTTTYDNWSQPVAIYERLVYGGVTSTTYYEVEATIYNITYEIDPSNVVGLIPFDIFNYYTADASKYNITNPIIQNAVQAAIGNETNLYWKAKLLHDYVKNNLQYALGGGWDEAPVVLSRGNGSCSECSFLYIALCRAAGIPARYIGGTITSCSTCPIPSTPFNDTAFHRWTQIYLPNYGWIPVDVTWDDSTNSDIYFGTTSNKCFVTTISGGPSNLLGWTYNCLDSCEPKPCDMIIERVATWFEYEKESPYTPNIPDGPLQGTIEVNYEYKTSTIEPGGDPVWFWFDWGDGAASGWLGPYRSEEECTASHRWKTEGNYQIKVKAKDIWDYESDWSDPLSVSMPKIKSFDKPLFQFIKNHTDIFQLIQQLVELFY
jgi:transglutaminase-like putative cysteine protease